MEKIDAGDGNLDNFSRGYEKFGIIIDENNRVTVREWAPGAHKLYLTGDFSTLIELLSIKNL